MDTKKTGKKVVSFIGKYFKQAGKKTAVVGVSGGLDSAVTLALCCRALGKKNVIAVLLPSSSNSKKDRKDAKRLAKKLGVKTVHSDIEPALYTFGWLSENRIGRANLSARIRMAVLYSLAHKYEGLVVGTGNKSELMLGYFTKHGDGGADLFPLGGLYKTEVKQLAARIGIPKRILSKPPSPALWKGQTAEGELGFSYEEADKVLRAIEKRTPLPVLRRKFGKKQADAICQRMRENRHKRLPAPVCKF